MFFSSAIESAKSLALNCKFFNSKINLCKNKNFKFVFLKIDGNYITCHHES